MTVEHEIGILIKKVIMDIIDILKTQLRQNLEIFQDLLTNINKEQLKTRRRPQKWSIHEHICHMAEVETATYDRFLTFKNVEYPVFQPFLQGTTRPEDHLINMKLKKAIRQYKDTRAKTLTLLNSFENQDWEKEATHPEYKICTPKILLRHLVMHDQFHLYRIEELWLTRDTYLTA